MCLIEVEMKGIKQKEYSTMLALLTRLFAEEYISKKERFTTESNFKYMYVAPTGEIAYTNLENNIPLSYAL